MGLEEARRSCLSGKSMRDMIQFFRTLALATSMHRDDELYYSRIEN